MVAKYEDSFVSVAIDECLMKEKTDVEEKMDVVSKHWGYDLKLSTNSARIINQHLQQHFGRSLFDSEAECRKYFASSNFPWAVLTKKNNYIFLVQKPWPLYSEPIKRCDWFLTVKRSSWKVLIRVDIIIGGPRWW
jgi:hypothetical protein